jgi:phospholipase C
VAVASSARTAAPTAPSVAAATPATAIKHVVVIFDENISFDHYFGTYPFAPNPAGEPAFHPAAGTPTVNGLYSSIGAKGPAGPLLSNNPNGSNPLRLDHNDPMTCDQGHGYASEQLAADHGAQDMYPANTGKNAHLDACLTGLTFNGSPEPIPSGAASNFAVMDYYDGNTVTGLWNYAQHYAMSDNYFGDTYGPSTLGALNVTASNTYGATCGSTSASINDSPCTAPPGLNVANPVATTSISPGPAVPAGLGTTVGDGDPTYDICSYLPKADGGGNDTAAATVTMGGNNIGVELSAANLTWGWFEGGFDHGFVPGHGTKPTTAQICSQSHKNAGGVSFTDYVSHHEPFQYYASTANPMHKPPSSVAMIGHTDQANHQYDIADFWAAANAGNLPQVSFLKAPAYQDGHAGYSDPLDEQTWLANTINRIEALKQWASTAIFITYDDSDGWYDSILGPLLTQSQVPLLDGLTATGQCGASLSQVPMTTTHLPEQGRCGVGPRLPFLVISPWAKKNFVDSTFADQSSVDNFIEFNWHLKGLGNGAADAAAGSILPMFTFGKTAANGTLFINPSTGEPESKP